jgi:hypothetical protein
MDLKLGIFVVPDATNAASTVTQILGVDILPRVHELIGLTPRTPPATGAK